MWAAGSLLASLSMLLLADGVTAQLGPTGCAVRIRRSFNQGQYLNLAEVQLFDSKGAQIPSSVLSFTLSSTYGGFMLASNWYALMARASSRAAAVQASHCDACAQPHQNSYCGRHSTHAAHASIFLFSPSRAPCPLAATMASPAPLTRTSCAAPPTATPTPGCAWTTPARAA